MKKIIAKTREGAEFIYSKKSSYSVATSSAEKICNTLNNARWNLQAGEKWHVYDVGAWELEYMNAGFQRLTTRNGRIMTAYI